MIYYFFINNYGVNVVLKLKKANVKYHLLVITYRLLVKTYRLLVKVFSKIENRIN